MAQGRPARQRVPASNLVDKSDTETSGSDSDSSEHHIIDTDDPYTKGVRVAGHPSPRVQVKALTEGQTKWENLYSARCSTSSKKVCNVSNYPKLKRTFANVTSTA